MIQPKIDAERFIVLVAFEPLIAFQRSEYGWAVAAPGEAYYAPATHPGGGNLDGAFVERLGHAFLTRIGKPALRTLRPTAKPLATAALTNYLIMLCAGDIFTFEDAFKKASGDYPAVIEFQTQVVINAIEQHGRPDLQAAIGGLKREAMQEALLRIQVQAVSALDAIDEEKGPLVTLSLMQCATTIKFALELLLRP